MDLKELEKLSDEQLRAKCAELAGTANRWAIMKRGLYYRPNAKGYTSNLEEAWIVSEEEADEHVYPHDEPVKKERVPSPNYPKDLNACAEFEKDAPNDYWDNLAIVTHCDRNPFYEAAPPSAWADFASASAKLRTIAYILTKSNQ